MLKWLTRNDGTRMARAKRRMASSRASVYVEFAMIVPVVALVCSALIEIVGLWDAQVMANHAAWTVGRIVMVRGSDGLAFSSDIAKKTKTGIISGSGMPEEIKKALSDIDSIVAGAGKFNDRANIATLFLMSTCGIGYYGYSPRSAATKIFETLCKAGVQALTEGIPAWISGLVNNIEYPSFIGGGGSAIAEFVDDLVKGILNKIVDAVLKPIAEALSSLLQKAFNKIMDAIDLDGLFAGDSAAARRARQIYGAGVRIVRAKTTIGKEVVTVKDMDGLNDYFIFAEKNSHREFRHLAYPQVVDAGAKSDGYFVKDYHGWPANAQGHAMVHVEVNWPYESGWLFPIVSARADKSTGSPPVATGHSMVFPQPNIANDNLYSEGATAFDPGEYTNNTTAAYQDIVDDMRNYMRFVLFGMKYRISDETLTLKDGPYRVIPAQHWKYISQLKDLWPFNVKDRDSYPREGDYKRCWSAITDNSSQDRVTRELEGYFKTSSYHWRDYFFWDGQHFKYKMSSGNAGLMYWYATNPKYTYADDKSNLYNIRSSASRFGGSGGFGGSSGITFGVGVTDDEFSRLYKKYKKQLKNAVPDDSSEDILRSTIGKFAARHSINVANIVKWQQGRSYDKWVEMDKSIQTLAMKSEVAFPKILSLVRSEIKEVEDIVNGGGEYEGNPEDPVITPEDESTMADPDAAAAKTREKWEAMKNALKAKLAEVDNAVVALRNSWSAYRNAADAFTRDREKCVPTYFIETCFKLIIEKQSLDMFKEGSSLVLPDSVMVYNVYDKTQEMLGKVDDYHTKLDDAYQRELEYGLLMGLQSAGKAQREGKSIDEAVDSAGDPSADNPGSLTPGSDKDAIINNDHQEFSGGKWGWK